MTICIWNHGHPLKTDDPITVERQKWNPITIDEFFDGIEEQRRQTILGMQLLEVWCCGCGYDMPIGAKTCIKCGAQKPQDEYL